MKRITKNQWKEYGMITVATAIVASSVFFFLVPSTVSVGSISGLAIVISNFVPLPISAITFVLNTGLLIVGFFLIGLSVAAAYLLFPERFKLFGGCALRFRHHDIPLFFPQFPFKGALLLAFRVCLVVLLFRLYEVLRVRNG